MFRNLQTYTLTRTKQHTNKTNNHNTKHYKCEIVPTSQGQAHRGSFSVAAFRAPHLSAHTVTLQNWCARQASTWVLISHLKHASKDGDKLDNHRQRKKKDMRALKHARTNPCSLARSGTAALTHLCNSNYRKRLPLSRWALLTSRSDTQYSVSASSCAMLSSTELASGWSWWKRARTSEGDRSLSLPSTLRMPS